MNAAQILVFENARCYASQGTIPVMEFGTGGMCPHVLKSFTEVFLLLVTDILYFVC